MIYNTASTTELSATSLQDISENNSQLNSDIKYALKGVKERRTLNHNGKAYKINVIEFRNPYKPFAKIIENSQRISL